MLNANVAFLTLGANIWAKSFSFVSTVTSVGVVVLGLILVRQNQRKDQDSAEQAVWIAQLFILSYIIRLNDISERISGRHVTRGVWNGNFGCYIQSSLCASHVEVSYG